MPKTESLAPNSYHSGYSFAQNALSSYYRPEVFSDDEHHYKQFCDWYMKHPT